MVEQIHAVNSSIKIRGMADSGFFVEYTGGRQYTKRKEWHEEEVVDGVLDFATSMRNVFTFANMSAGVHSDCIYRHDQSSMSSCIFAKNIIRHIKTPIFIIQPQYDQWQIWHVYGGPDNYTLLNQIGRSIVQDISSLLLTKRQNGAFFDACTHHCTSCSNQPEDSWNGGRIHATFEGNNHTIVTPAIAFARWYSDDSIDKQQSSRSLSYMRGLSDGFISTNDRDMIDNHHVYIQKAEYPCHSCCICHA